jgi:hypothetical protein
MRVYGVYGVYTQLLRLGFSKHRIVTRPWGSRRGFAEVLLTLGMRQPASQSVASLGVLR